MRVQEGNMKKHISAILIAAALFAGVTAHNFPSVVPASAEPVGSAYFDMEAHRGGRDARPENTLYSFAYAIEMGASVIECDVQLTADKNIVVSHNPLLNSEITRYKGTDRYVGTDIYDIRKMTVAEIKKFDVARIAEDPNPESYYGLHGRTQVTPESAEIPTLDELFMLVKDTGYDGMINIETKLYPDPECRVEYANNADCKKFVKILYDKVKKYGLEKQVILQSFDWSSLIEMKKIAPEILTSALWSRQPSWGAGGDTVRAGSADKSPWLGGIDIKDYGGDPIKAAHAISADIVSPYFCELSKDDVTLAHKYGMKVVPWTVNDESDMEMLYDMGVDGIITDRPWLLRSLLEKKGAKIPPLRPTVKTYHLEPNHRDVKTKRAGNDSDVSS